VVVAAVVAQLVVLAELAARVARLPL